MASMGALRAVESAMAKKKKQQPVSAFGALREVEAKMPTVPGVSAAPKVPSVPTVTAVRSELERAAAEREAQRRQEYLAEKARERAERLATTKEEQAVQVEPKAPSRNVWSGRTEIARLGWSGPVRIPDVVERTAEVASAAAPATTGIGALRKAEASASAATPTAAIGALRLAEAGQGLPTVPGLQVAPMVPGVQPRPVTVAEPERQALAVQAGPPPGYGEAERQAYAQAGGIQGALERLEGGQGGIDIQGIINRTVEEIMSGYDRAAPNVQLMYGQLMDQLMASLEATEASIRKMFEEQMGGIDPATQAALSQLREAMQQKREQLLADLNRRGLLQSGIALEMQARLHKNELTAEEQLIAGRFQQLQDQLNNALMQFAQQRLNLATQLGVAGIQSAERQALQRQQALMGALQTGISLAGLQAQELARQQQAALAERQFQAQQAAQMAGLTGYIPETGQKTLAREQLEWQMSRGAGTAQPLQGILRDSAYAKLAMGYTVDQLSEGERLAVGIRPATERTFSPAETRAKAVQLAQTDTRWLYASPEQRQQIIAEYESWITPPAPAPVAAAPAAQGMGNLRQVEAASNVTDSLVQSMKRMGYPDEEIAAVLRQLGFNPASFGIYVR